MQTIISGGGAQEVEVYARDSAGRLAVPATATAQIVDTSLADGAAGRIILATSPASIDPVSTTITAAAGPRTANPRALVVADATGVTAGRQYLVATGLATESVVVDRVNGLSVYCRDPLRFTYPIGATVQGLRVSVEFPAATADDPNELARDVQFGVDWTFTGTTGPTPVRELAKIQRRAKALRATVADMLRVDSQLAPSTRERTRLDDHLAVADEEVTAELEARNVDDANTVDGKIGKLAVVWRAIELAYRSLDSTHEGRADAAALQAARWRKILMSGHKSPDRVETSRTEDRRRPTRSPGALGIIRSNT